jgi:hypothetical protein
MLIKGTWADGSALTAIPYYGRSNRITGSAEDRRRREALSIVWLRDQ